MDACRWVEMCLRCCDHMTPIHGEAAIYTGVYMITTWDLPGCWWPRLSGGVMAVCVQSTVMDAVLSKVARMSQKKKNLWPANRREDYAGGNEAEEPSGPDDVQALDRVVHLIRAQHPQFPL
jgi:hypothetical protein